MRKCRKKVDNEFEQFVIWDKKDCPLFIDIHGVCFPVYNNESEPYIVIPTLEGNLKAKNLDYILKGTKGELWPVRQDIFESTYEEIK